MEGYLSEIRLFAGNFAPRAWAFCAGQLLLISQNDALFALIGTIYGGDGQTTFQLPNIQSRVAIGTGQGPGLSNYILGQISGTEYNTLTGANLAAHTHAITGSAGILVSVQDGHQKPAINNYPAVSGDNLYASSSDGQMAAPQISLTVPPQGSSIPISNIKPVLALNYIICIEGIFPSRN